MSRPVCIALLGAESTGKTTLGQQLVIGLEAQGLSTRLIPEYLRQWCIEHQRTPQAGEQAGIMERQMQIHREFEVRATTESIHVLISDCAPITTSLYSEQYFADSSLRAPASRWHQQTYRLSLVLQPDFDWQADPIPYLRDGPEARANHHRRLEEWVAEQLVLERRVSKKTRSQPSTPTFLRLCGPLEQRLMAAQSAILALNARGPA